MKQYYQISHTGYPIISAVMLPDLIEYEVGLEPKELKDAFRSQERKEKIEALKNKFKEKANVTKIEMLLIHSLLAYLVFKTTG